MTRTPIHPDIEILRALPRCPGLIIEGGQRMLGLYLRDGKETTQPSVALWIDATTGAVRAHRLINPRRSTDAGMAETLNLLIDAIAHPVATQPEPSLFIVEGETLNPVPEAPIEQPAGLPDLVQVNDPGLAQATSDLLSPLGITVEQTDQLAAFNEAYDSLAEFMGASPDEVPPEPFSWDVDLALLSLLYKAAARYAKQRPWEWLPDNPPFAITLNEHGPNADVETLYGAVLGAGGEVFGVALYFSAQAYRRSRDRGARLDVGGEIDDAVVAKVHALLRLEGFAEETVSTETVRSGLASLDPAILSALTATEDQEGLNSDAVEDSLVMYLDDENDVDPTYLGWLDTHAIKIARYAVPSFMRTVYQGTFRDPDDREVRTFTLALEGLHSFMQTFKQDLMAPLPLAPLVHTTRVGKGSRQVEVTIALPAPDFTWDE